MQTPVVTIKQGSLQGRVIKSPNGGKINCFLGIPYAEPPTGELRFKPPVPAKGWTGIRDASKEGNECAQVQMISKSTTGSEDCLYLNVMCPDIDYKNANNKKIPVMIQLHGGGFINGSGNMNLFSPDFLVEQDTILVSINYRLNIFGFMCLNIPEAPGNMGLRDQNLAFRWIKENIQSFGGDPDNVTLFGISAGAAAAEYHVLSPMSKGLFHKVILESGSALSPCFRQNDPIGLVKRSIEHLGGTYETPEAAFEFLKKQSVEALANASYKINCDQDLKRADFFLYTPVVEKKFPNVEPFLAEEPIKLIKSGNFVKLPTLFGFCDREGILFKNFFYGSHVAKLKQHRYIDYFPSCFYKDKDITDELLRSTYKRSFDDKNPEDSVNNFLTDMLFVGPIITSMEGRLKFGDCENFFYQFCHDGKLNYLKKTLNYTEKGATHGDDLTYLSKSYYMNEDVATASDLLVRKRMVEMWTNFASKSNPTPAKTPLIKTIWQPVKKDKLFMMEIGSEMVMRSNPIPERIKFWKEKFDYFYENQ